MLISQKCDYKCNVKVDLDHLLLDGGWKRGEVDWLRWVELGDTKNTNNAYLVVYLYIHIVIATVFCTQVRGSGHPDHLGGRDQRAVHRLRDPGRHAGRHLRQHQGRGLQGDLHLPLGEVSTGITSIFGSNI